MLAGVPFYVATESDSPLLSPPLRPFKLHSLSRTLAQLEAPAQPASLLNTSSSHALNHTQRLAPLNELIATARASLSDPMLAVVLDQLVCAKATYLLLNVRPTVRRDECACGHGSVGGFVACRCISHLGVSVHHFQVFSTFSQMVLMRIGLSHSQHLGWVRDLSSSQQEKIGKRVDFFRRVDPFNEETLL